MVIGNGNSWLFPTKQIISDRRRAGRSQATSTSAAKAFHPKSVHAMIDVANAIEGLQGAIANINGELAQEDG